MSDENGQEKPSRWRSGLKVFAVMLSYMIPLFWLWSKTGYPDSLGAHILARGKAGLIESWWYSYLLLGRDTSWDILTFVYMWLPVLGCVIWLGRAFVQDRKAKGG